MSSKKNKTKHFVRDKLGPTAALAVFEMPSLMHEKRFINLIWDLASHRLSFRVLISIREPGEASHKYPHNICFWTDIAAYESRHGTRTSSFNVFAHVRASLCHYQASSRPRRGLRRKNDVAKQNCGCPTRHYTLKRRGTWGEGLDLTADLRTTQSNLDITRCGGFIIGGFALTRLVVANNRLADDDQNGL